MLKDYRDVEVLLVDDVQFLENKQQSVTTFFDIFNQLISKGKQIVLAVDTAHMDLLVAAYVFKLLSHVGYRPDFSACVLCGDPMLSYFSPQAGGLMCGSCASSVPGAELVSTGEVAWLRTLMSMTFDALMVERIDPHTAAFLLGLSHVWAATHTDQRLRAMEFMLGR